MDTVYDAIIVGGGPAGLSAAIYMARARFHVLVIEKEKMGGQITITSEVVNYPGIFHTSGEKLTSEMIRQAKAFGAEFLSADVTGLELEGDYKTVHTSRGDFKALGIIYAGGAHPRLAGFTGETEFRGHGVAYCATCDGEFSPAALSSSLAAVMQLWKRASSSQSTERRLSWLSGEMISPSTPLQWKN